MLKSKIEKAKNIILPIQGGIGRNIFATAMIKNLKNTYSDKNIFVVCGFPDIFLNNPNVKRVYGFGSAQHLFEDFINNNPDSFVIETEPYRHPEYIAGNLHIVRAWCDLMEIPCNDVYPELYFTRNEQEMAKAYIAKFNQPMILLQHTGGKIPNNSDKQTQIADAGAMFRRNLREKVIQEVVDGLIADGYMVGSVQGVNQFVPDKAERITFALRAVLSLIPHVSGIIAIDSFLQHGAAAQGVKSLVLWAGTSPERLGYDLHKNLRRNVCPTPECHRPNTFCFDVQPNGFQWDCPYGDICTDYDSKTILEAYKEMKGKEYKKDVKNFNKKRDEILSTAPKPVMGLSKDAVCPVHSHGG